MQKSNWAGQLGGRARAILALALCAPLTAGAAPAWAAEIGDEPSTARSASSSLAEDRSYRNNDDDDWKFYAGAYGWFLFLNGALDVQDEQAPISVDFGAIWDHLHMAMFFEGEVQKGDFGVFTDVAWARLWNRQEAQFPLRNRTVKTDLDWALLDFGIYWEALKLDLGSGPLPPRLRLQPYFGGRYLWFGTRIKVQPPPPLTDGTISPALNTAAPVLGLRGFVDFNEHWNLLFAGDGGGFGVDGMDVTWLGELQGGYRFRFKSWDINVTAGYKAVGTDVAGSSKDIEADIIFHGPILRFGAEF